MKRASAILLSVAVLFVLSFTGCGKSDDGGSSGAPDTLGTPDGSLATTLLTTCSDAPPPGASQAPDPPSYGGGTCPMLTTGTTFSHITSSGKDRQFLVVVPDGMKPEEKLPVVFLWHWLGGKAMDFYNIVNAQVAVNQQRFIAVIPEAIGSSPAVWRAWFTLDSPDQAQEEFTFFDDMLSCISRQFPVNKNCVSSAGVSDGALFTSQLIGARGQYLSSALVLSGGVNNPDDSSTGIIRPYIPSSHSMPVVVLWGGANDICIILHFEPATKALEAALVKEHHFIVECEHNCGHAVPPISAPDGGTVLDIMWKFVRDHPYWLPPGDSPYEKSGLPAGWPDWCAVGAGNAKGRTDPMGCGNLGCPVVPSPAPTASTSMP